MDIGENLRRLRERKGYTQGQLAELVDRSRPLVNQWECGTKTVPSALLPVLGNVLDCTVDDLLAENKDD